MKYRYKVELIIPTEEKALDYSQRNRKANAGWLRYKRAENEADRYATVKANALYICIHINAGGGSYVLSIINNNASKRSLEIAKRMSLHMANRLSSVASGMAPAIPKYGNTEGVWRKDHTVWHTMMPALVIEPLFGDNERQAEYLMSDGIDHIADAVEATIREALPGGGYIVLAPGHGWRTNPYRFDPGCAIIGGYREHDICCMIAEKIKERFDADNS